MKFNFGWGSAPYPTGAAPDSWLDFTGVLLLREGKKGEEKKTRKGGG